MMRKIILLEFVSLDGVMQAPGGPEEDTSGGFEYGGWTFPYFDDEAGEMMGKQMAGEYDLLLGRKTYDIFSNYWPHHEEGWPQVNKITKYVATTKPIKDPWENTVILKDVNEIKELKQKDGPPLQVYGSGNLTQSLLKHDLVDELWLKIFPVILGNGKKLFEEGIKANEFELINSVTTGKGIIFANYKRGGKVKTGSFE